MKIVERGLEVYDRLGAVGCFRASVFRAASHFSRLVNLRANRAIARAHAISTSQMTSQEKFDAIYRERIWAKASPTLFSSESLSGHGSTELSTRELRAGLEKIIRENSVQGLFDALRGFQLDEDDAVSQRVRLLWRRHCSVSDRIQ